MFRKLSITIAAIALVFIAGANAASFAKKSNSLRPTIQFIKNDQVIESRELYDDEYDAYKKLQQLGETMDITAKPMELMEAEIEAQAEQVELSVAAMLENKFAEHTENDQYYDDDKDEALQKLKLLVTKIKPTIKEIKLVAKQIKVAAQDFEQRIELNTPSDGYDSFDLIDKNGRHSKHIIH